MINTVMPAQGPDNLRLLSVHFADQVAAATTKTLSRKILQDATLTGLRIRIYAGAELALRIRPYVQNTRGQRQDLVDYADGGKQYIDGDDDTYFFPIRIPVNGNTDTLHVEVENTDPTHSYDFAVDVTLDFANGKYPGVNDRG